MPSMNSSNIPLLCSSGTPAGSSQRCCGVPQLIRCCDGVPSGIGLLPAHTPSRITDNVVSYLGDCHSIGSVQTGLTPTTTDATDAGGAGCGGSTCLEQGVPTSCPSSGLASTYTVFLPNPFNTVCNYSVDTGTLGVTGTCFSGASTGYYCVPISGVPLTLSGACAWRAGFGFSGYLNSYSDPHTCDVLRSSSRITQSCSGVPIGDMYLYLGLGSPRYSILQIAFDLGSVSATFQFLKCAGPTPSGVYAPGGIVYSLNWYYGHTFAQNVLIA